MTLHAEAQRRYRERNREQINARDRARRAANPEAYRAVQRASSAKLQPWKTRRHKASQFAFRSNQRAQKLGAAGRLSATDVRRLDGPCVYCGGPATGWDHVVPMSRGGANEIGNLVSCCRRCNRAKGFRLPEEAGMRRSA